MVQLKHIKKCHEKVDFGDLIISKSVFWIDKRGYVQVYAIYKTILFQVEVQLIKVVEAIGIILK